MRQKRIKGSNPFVSANPKSKGPRSAGPFCFRGLPCEAVRIWPGVPLCDTPSRQAASGQGGAQFAQQRHLFGDPAGKAAAATTTVDQQIVQHLQAQHP